MMDEPSQLEGFNTRQLCPRHNLPAVCPCLDDEPDCPAICGECYAENERESERRIYGG